MNDPLPLKEREIELTEALALISLMARHPEPDTLVKIGEMAETVLRKAKNENICH